MTQIYCTSTHVAFVLSDAGVTARIDDDESGVASVEEEAKIDTAIAWAATVINRAVQNQYKLSDVTANVELQMMNAVLAADLLSQRRAQEVSPILADRAQRIKDQLIEIRWGRERLSEQNDSFDFRPTVSNYVPILGSARPIKVDLNNSNGPSPADGTGYRNTYAAFGWW